MQVVPFVYYGSGVVGWVELQPGVTGSMISVMNITLVGRDGLVLGMGEPTAGPVLYLALPFKDVAYEVPNIGIATRGINWLAAGEAFGFLVTDSGAAGTLDWAVMGNLRIE